MKAIWKFPIVITDEQKVLMPKSAQILSVQVQHGTPCIWAICDAEEGKVERTFVIHGTGHTCGCVVEDFIGTFQMSDGDFVFHLFNGSDT